MHREKMTIKMRMVHTDLYLLENGVLDLVSRELPFMGIMLSTRDRATYHPRLASKVNLWAWSLSCIAVPQNGCQNVEVEVSQVALLYS